MKLVSGSISVMETFHFILATKCRRFFQHTDFVLNIGIVLKKKTHDKISLKFPLYSRVLLSNFQIESGTQQFTGYDHR